MSSSAALLMELDGVSPTIGRDVWLAPTAVLVGDVRVGDNASIWFGAVLRGDSATIHIGAGTAVQDNAVVHCASDLPTVVGEDVIVGHGAMLEGCVVEDGAVVGMGAIVLQHARLGAGAMLAAGAVLAERGEVTGGMLAVGVPAREKKPLSGAAERWSGIAVDDYQELRRRYLAAHAPSADVVGCGGERGETDCRRGPPSSEPARPASMPPTSCSRAGSRSTCSTRCRRRTGWCAPGSLPTIRR